MKVTIDNLRGAENVLHAALTRGNIPTNYAIDRNLTLVIDALKPFMNDREKEPMCWHFWDQLHPEHKAKSKPKGKKKDEKKEENVDGPTPPTKEQRKEGMEALSEYLATEVDFQPYKLELDRCVDILMPLSKFREVLNDDDLLFLNENFFITLKVLGILTDGGES